MEPEEFNLAAKEDIEAHIDSLRELAKVVNRIMCQMVASELRIRFSMRELELAIQNVAVTDLHKPNELLTAREVAQRLGVSVWTLRNNHTGKYPSPWPHGGKSLVYRQVDIDEWLSSRA